MRERPFRFPIRTALLTVLAVALPAPAQQHRDDSASYNVLFEARSFDLDEFRGAIRRRVSDRRLQEIVAGLEAAVRRDQAAFAGRVRALGGRVVVKWWIINGCNIRIAPSQLEAVRALPNVARVEVDAVRRPHLETATNKAHHASDQANQMKDRTGRLLTGTGVAVAVLDTGADAVSGTKGRPHASYYPGGDPTNNNNGGIQGSLLLEARKVAQVSSTEDVTGHGTAVIGCAAANKWNTLARVDSAIAPGAGVVSVNIANSAGVSQDSWLVSGWQLVASLRIKHNIGVGNNSYSGSPQLSNVLQQALDSTAYNADILICVSAGNLGSNTRESQHAFNGLAVGSVDKTFLSRSSFSAIGPLSGTTRTYPDVTAVGNAVTTVLADQEGSKKIVGGTSYAAPMVAGAAALVRQAELGLSANQVRAILLHTALFRSANRNEYGIGFMKADRAVAAALTGEVVTGAVATNRTKSTFLFKVANSGTETVTVTWMRTHLNDPNPPNLDLRLFDASNRLVAKDLNPANSYEHVRFAATASMTYRAEVTWTNPQAGFDPISFAIVGVANHAPPTLVASTPTKVTSFQPGAVDLVGTGLATVTKLDFGGTSVGFTVLDDTHLRFTPPNLYPIGSVPIVVTNPKGQSNVLALRVTGLAKPLFVGPGVVIRGAQKFRYDLYSDKNWLSLLFVSLSDNPSRIPGIFEFGIGNNFSILVPLVYLNQDTSGASTIQFTYPTTIPWGTKIFFQALSVDKFAPTLPYPASNVLLVQIY